MAIDRVHWKVGDWILAIGKGYREIKAIEDDGIVFLACTHSDGREDVRKFLYENVHFAGPAESVNWKKGDTVYVDGITPIQIEYCQHRPCGVIEYVEWNGDWDSAYGERLTATPLDPILVKKAEHRIRRLELEQLAQKIADLTEGCPDGTKRWLNDMLESFKCDFEDQLQDENNV